MNWDLLLGAGAGIVTAIVAAVAMWRRLPMEEKKAQADAAEAITAAAAELVDDLRCEATRLQQRMRTLEQKMQEQGKEIISLREELQIARHRIKLLEEENRRLRVENERVREVYERLNGQRK